MAENQRWRVDLRDADDENICYREVMAPDKDAAEVQALRIYNATRSVAYDLTAVTAWAEPSKRRGG